MFRCSLDRSPIPRTLLGRFSETQSRHSFSAPLALFCPYVGVQFVSAPHSVVALLLDRQLADKNRYVLSQTLKALLSRA